MSEPEWDTASREWAQALQFREATMCPCGCGYPAAVTQSPANEFRFFVDDPVRCHARTALVNKQERDAEKNMATPDALLYSVELTGTGGQRDG